MFSLRTLASAAMIQSPCTSTQLGPFEKAVGPWAPYTADGSQFVVTQSSATLENDLQKNIFGKSAQAMPT